MDETIAENKPIRIFDNDGMRNHKEMMMYKTTQTLILMSILVSTVCVAKSKKPSPPVKAPKGYEWVLNESYSDEFNGTALDRNKWKDYYIGWEGRIPGRFVPASISVKDGFLQIKSTVLDPPQGVSNEWTIACGAVQSKESGAFHGYYEARVKASDVSTSTTFWLKNYWDKKTRPFKATELDILECIGNAQRWPDFGDHMMSNTHITYYPEDENEEPVNLKKGDKHPIGSSVSKDFHTYGCWWVDANTMKFYFDGKHVYTIEPSTEVDEKPFDQKLFLNMVCEIYTWEVTPKVKELMDSSRNTTYYDYVRSYKLVKIND